MEGKTAEIECSYERGRAEAGGRGNLVWQLQTNLGMWRPDGTHLVLLADGGGAAGDRQRCWQLERK